MAGSDLIVTAGGARFRLGYAQLIERTGSIDAQKFGIDRGCPELR
jgi:hypothetical protein